MDAIAFIVIFQSMNSILTKGVLRGGGDTKFLMVADIIFLWAASLPLGILAGLVWQFDGRAEARIIEIACSPAPEGHSRWTLRLLEEQAKIVLDVPVSKDTIGRALKKINFDLT